MLHNRRLACSVGDLEQIPNFRYAALPDASHIRLLHVLPRTDEETIRCKCLPHSLLGPRLEYTAISYTWGDASLTEPIVLNGERYFTTKNARKVLEYVRRTGGIHAIWIDAICINQSDIPERNAQVRLMDSVYSHAQQTIVWLGEVSNDSDLALDFVPVINSALDSLRKSGGVTEKLLLEITATDYDSPQWQALGRLLARPWFQRTWVIQEVALSQVVNIACGDKTISWHALGSMVDFLLEWRLAHLLANSPSSQQLTSGVSLLWSMQNIRSQLKTYGRRWISEVLFETMGFLSTDPRDRFFGVLALIKSDSHNADPPSYSDSVQEVYTKVTRASLQYEERFDLLYIAGITHARTLLDLPSWVPDLSHEVAINPFGLPHPGQVLRYKAGGTATVGSSASLHFHGKYLVLQGLIVDEVAAFTRVRVAKNQECNAEQHTAWRDWIIEARELAQPYQKTERLWRTLIAGVGHPRKEEAPACYEEYFSSFEKVYIDDSRHQGMDWKQAQARVAKDGAIEDDVKAAANSYLFAFLDASIGRRFSVTMKGRFALVPDGCVTGDMVCLVSGAPVPLVLRQVESSESTRRTFVLVGDCYVDGYMEGEGMVDGKIEEIFIR
jgi:hypothetical protein